MLADNWTPPSTIEECQVGDSPYNSEEMAMKRGEIILDYSDSEDEEDEEEMQR